MVRVLLVGKGAPDKGGIPTFLRTLMTCDLAREHQLELLNLTRDEAPQGGRLTVYNLRRTAQDMRRVWRRAPSADVVHVHTALAPAVTAARAGLLSAAARLRGRPVILHAHGGLVRDWADTAWKRVLLRLALAPSRTVITVSTGVHDTLKLLLGRKSVLLVDNGVDVDAFVPAVRHRSTPLVLYVGLLTPRKGVLDLFRASTMLLERGVRHELALVGGTPDEGGESEDVVRAALPPTAKLLGPRSAAEMPAIYATADVFCLPSWWEAMPLSLLEAMASGLPVVATDVGDVARLIAPPTAGLLVAPRSPELLAAALERLLVDPELRQAVGSAARQRVMSDFSSAATARNLDGVYRTVAVRS